MTAATPLLSLRGVRKEFPGVVALDDVDFEVRPGEVHALLGENGAGKSTLIKVLTGVYPRDGGEMSLGGGTLSPQSVGEAQAAGISTVYQEVNLLPNLSVAQNLLLGREPRRFGLTDWKQMNAKARETLTRFRLDIDVTRPLGAFSVAIQQLVAIARGVDQRAKILVLDEPTASLDATNRQTVLDMIDAAKQRGCAILGIFHDYAAREAVCDREIDVSQFAVE